MQASSKLCVVVSEIEAKYVNALKEATVTATGYAKADESMSPVLVATRAKSAGCCGVVVCSDKMFDSLTKYANIPDAKRSAYEGSIFDVDGMEFLVLPFLQQLYSSPQQKFLAAHYVTKLTKKDAWPVLPEHKWIIAAPEEVDSIVASYSSALIVAMDLETQNNPEFGPVPTMCCFTGVWLDDKKLSMFTVVVPTDNDWWLEAFRKLADVPAYKVMQNGLYDLAFFTRFGVPVRNYALDTLEFHHSWYAELPKDLGAISAFAVRKSFYWKDLGKSGDRYTKLLYNSLDGYNTAAAAIFYILKLPAWGWKNYNMKFSCFFPAHLSMMRGVLVDQQQFKIAKEQLEVELSNAEEVLGRSVGNRAFNANSSKQVLSLLTLLGAKVESSGEQVLEMLAYTDAFIGHFAAQILEIRGKKKLLGTYFNSAKWFKGRFVYSLAPSGTITGRNASSEHPFWAGQNMQNIPRGKEVKQFLIADEGFVLFECDSEQAESRDTAYISGDERLIDAVDGIHDFHSLNCSAFFGIPYEQIYDDATHKKLMPELRDQAKRVNHGANYVMGPTVLVATMGRKAIDYVRKVVGLPKHWSYNKVAEYLLAQFHLTYPGISGKYYRWVVRCVKTTKMIVNPMGWTRYCFGDINNKHTYNGYMAHTPSSTNAIRLDQAWKSVFNELSMHPVHGQNLRVLMQIHDSIFGQVRIGHEYLIQEIADRMQISITLTSCDGKQRTYVVPSAVKAGKNKTGAHRWSETE